MLIRILLLLREESNRVIAPMAEWVQVVRSVVAVIVAIAVALTRVSLLSL
jgi:hypothetical protein